MAIGVTVIRYIQKNLSTTYDFNPFNFLLAIIRIENLDTQHNRIENPIGQCSIHKVQSMCMNISKKNWR